MNWIYKVIAPILAIKMVTPRSWNELTVSELRRVIPILMNDQMNMLAKRHKLIMATLRPENGKRGIRFLIQKRIVDRNILTLQALGDVDWMFEMINLTRFGSPWIVIGGSRFYPPANSLKNLNLEEFGYAEDVFENFNRTKDNKFLFILAAILLREKGIGARYNEKHIEFSGDVRRSFNPNTLMRDVELMKKHYRKNPEDIWRVYFFYFGCRENILSTFRFFQGGSEGGFKKRSMRNVINAMAGDRFGNIEQVGRSNLFKVLHVLDIELETKSK